MSEYRLTKRAEADLFDIFLFGYEQVGARQAEIYAAELEHTFQFLTDNPRIGREAEAIAPGLHFRPCPTQAASSGSLYSAAPARDFIAVSSPQTGPSLCYDSRMNESKSSSERELPVLSPTPLRPGDVVRFVSPASPPTQEGVSHGTEILQSWGLRVQLARNVFSRCPRLDYLAGTDEERLADFNEALCDPDVRAIIATRGGKGAYRIADKIDFAAARADPKFVVGFSEITILHLALWQRLALDWRLGLASPAASLPGATSAGLTRRQSIPRQAVAESVVGR